MGERVHAGGCGELRGKFDGQFGIEDHELGQEAGQKDDGPALGAKSSYHRAAPDFAAGAGGGRNANASRQTGPIFVRVETAKLKVRPFNKETAGFSDIKGAAPAKGDDQIA